MKRFFLFFLALFAIVSGPVFASGLDASFRAWVNVPESAIDLASTGYLYQIPSYVTEIEIYFRDVSATGANVPYVIITDTTRTPGLTYGSLSSTVAGSSSSAVIGGALGCPLGSAGGFSTASSIHGTVKFWRPSTAATFWYFNMLGSYANTGRTNQGSGAIGMYGATGYIEMHVTDTFDAGYISMRYR